MLEAGLICSRFTRLTCAIILFGVALFGLCSPVSGNRPERLAHSLSAVLLAAAVGAHASGFAWFLSAVANMSGALADAFDSDALQSVLWDTGFGRLWAARIVPASLIVAMIRWRDAFGLGQSPITIAAWAPSNRPNIQTITAVVEFRRAL
jgi:putative copper resistance protein D